MTLRIWLMRVMAAIAASMTKRLLLILFLKLKPRFLIHEYKTGKVILYGIQHLSRYLD